MTDTVTEKVIAQESGFSVRSLIRKRQRGVLPEGKVWRKEDGRIIYSRRAFDEWHWKSAENTYESRSNTKESESASSGRSKVVRPAFGQQRGRKIELSEI